MALKQIKNKIRSTQKTGKVTKAMEAVSAVKMRKSQERALAGRAYATVALRILEKLSASNEGRRHLFAQNRNVVRHLFVVVTSDKGLAGNFNNGVLKAVEHALAQHSQESIGFVCVGRKAFDYATLRGHTVEQKYLNVHDEVTVDDMDEIGKLVSILFQNKTYDAVSIVYQNFKSTFEQEPVVRRILPLSEDSIAEIVKGIVPTHGLYAHAEEHSTVATYTIEPSEEVVLEVLIPNLTQIMLYHAMIEAKASEHSARMVAMKNASDKAREVTKFLTLQFNKERQAVITREVSEITGGIEAMAQH